MRADLESLVHSTVKAHFAPSDGQHDFLWTLEAGGPPFSLTATFRSGTPDGPLMNPSAATLMVRPDDVPDGADAGDTVERVAAGQTYRVIEVKRRESSLTVVTLEKVE